MGWLWHTTGLLFTVMVGPNSVLELAEAVLSETDITVSIGPPVACTLQRWGRPRLAVGAGGSWYPRGDNAEAGRVRTSDVACTRPAILRF
eukprot:COSAG01_NODE_4171_length_5273_cov_169.689602_3_plen_90_part_00